MVFVIFFVALSLAGCSPASEPLDTSPSPLTVAVAEVQLAPSIARVTLPGRVEPSQKTTLSFEVPGQVTHLTLEAGDEFERGDTLARLNGDRYQLAFERSLATEEEARTTLADAQRELQRLVKLRRGGHTSEATLENAEAAVSSARARVDSAVASRKLAGRDLEQTSLQAPFDGTVARRHAEPGQRVAANQIVFDLVSSHNGFDVLVQVPENNIGRVQTQNTQAVTIPALDNARIMARVTHTGSHADTANHYPVILRLVGAVPGLRSGMTADVTFEIALGSAETPAGSLRVPLTSLRYPVESEPRVLRLDETNQLTSVPVTVVSVADNAVIVTGDLRVGERIVARGAEFVSEGDRVSVLGQGPERFH